MIFNECKCLHALEISQIILTLHFIWCLRDPLSQTQPLDLYRYTWYHSDVEGRMIQDLTSKSRYHISHHLRNRCTDLDQKSSQSALGRSMTGIILFYHVKLEGLKSSFGE